MYLGSEEAIDTPNDAQAFKADHKEVTGGKREVKNSKEAQATAGPKLSIREFGLFYSCGMVCWGLGHPLETCVTPPGGVMQVTGRLRADIKLTNKPERFRRVCTPSRSPSFFHRASFASFNWTTC